MHHRSLLLAIALGAMTLAGCAGGTDEAPEDPVDPAPARPPANPPPQPEPEPEPFEPVEVVNSTLAFDLQAVPPHPFNVPEGAGSLAGSLQVMPREVCSTLQRDADQRGPSVVFATTGFSHTYQLTPRSAACNTTGNMLEEWSVALPAMAGDWTVQLVGVGNVNVDLVLTAVP